jgi:hypothetical protein
MGDLFEIDHIKECRVFFEKNRDSKNRFYFSAYVQLPNSNQMILDDRILPRLKRRLGEVLSLTTWVNVN